MNVLHGVSYAVCAERKSDYAQRSQALLKVLPYRTGRNPARQLLMYTIGRYPLSIDKSGRSSY